MDWGDYNYYFLFAAIFTVICIVVVVCYKFTAFKLNVDLTTNFNKEDWADVHTISDVVTLNYAIFSSRDAARADFLTAKVESLVSSMKKRSIQWCLNFYFSLCELQSRKILPVQSHIMLLNAYILDILRVALTTLKDLCQVFLSDFAQIPLITIPPISNLTKYFGGNGCIVANSFLADFSNQMTTNLGGVDKIDSVARMKTHLVNLSLITKFCVKFDFKVGRENTNSLNEILGLLLEMKTIYKDNVEIMQSRYEQVENSLSSFSVECFRNKSALNYYAVHEDVFRDAFTGGPKNFPMKIPNILSHSENLLQVKNEAEYQKVKNNYIHISLLYAKYKKMAAIKWPAINILPNLSTDDLTPRLSIDNANDFEAILNVYAEYAKRLELLKQTWSSSLRAIVNTIEPLELFAKYAQ